jgi:hypothetical protein
LLEKNRNPQKQKQNSGKGQMKKSSVVPRMTGRFGFLIFFLEPILSAGSVGASTLFILLLNKLNCAGVPKHGQKGRGVIHSAKLKILCTQVLRGFGLFLSLERKEKPRKKKEPGT